MDIGMAIKPGIKVMVEGFEFEVISAYRSESNGFPYFYGRCTDNPVNNPIRGTTYDGGDYRLPESYAKECMV